MLVLGDEVFGVRRSADHDFRTNVAGGATCQAIELTGEEVSMARSISKTMALRIGSIDLIDNASGPPLVLEVNGVPGWKGAQGCLTFNIADKMIEVVLGE